MLSFSSKCSKFLALLLLALPVIAQDNLTARRPYGQHTQTFAASEIFDAGITDNWKITLTGNVTSSTLIGVEAGHTYTFEICQDGTGSRTFVWPSQLQNPLTIPSAANACITEIFQFDGTNGNIPTTTTSGGGGSGTVNSGTVNQIAKYSASTTVSSDANLDDGLTLANTLSYLGSGGISAQQYNAAGSGSMSLIGTESTSSGAAAGKDVLSLGDSVSHTAQISNNGDSFRSIALHQSTSPTPHGIMLSEAFPQMFAAPRGTQGQAFIEGSGAGDPGFGQLDISLSTNVINRLVKANQTAATVYNDQVNVFTAAGTLDLTGSTVASAFRVPVTAGITTALNGAIGYDSTNNNFHAGMNSADSLIPVVTTLPGNNDCLKAVVVSGNFKIASAGVGACGSGGSVRWDQILAATGAFSTDNGDNPFTVRFAPTTSGRNSWRITESAASTAGGTPLFFSVDTLPASTAFPCQITARGTSNGIRCDSVTGTLSALGSANINSTQVNGVSIPSTGSSTAGRIPITDGAGAAAWGDPIISQAYVNLWTAQDVTVTRTSAAVRNPVFSQTGTLQLTWASITGSPATCTLQIQAVDSQGNVLSNGSTFSVSPANGTTSQVFSAAAGLQSAAQVKAVFACVTYPTTGTLTLDFTPIPNVNVTNTAAHNLTQLAGTAVDTNSGNKSGGTQRMVIATDQPNLTTPLNVNTTQVAGTATSVNNGTTDAGTTRVTLSSDSTGQVIPAPTTASGDAVSACNILSAASTNSTNCKGSAGNFYGYEIYNTTTTIYYLRLYNASSAPTCSSATGFIRTIPIPPAGAAGQAGGAISNQVFPVNYGTGIGYCLTGGSSSTDNTNAATGVFGEIRYK